MKLLIVSEGRHELQTEDIQGALETLTRRLVGDFGGDKQRISDRKLPRLQGKFGPGGKHRRCFKRALEWMRYAQRRGYDGIVLVIDQDQYPERRIQIDTAQADLTFSIPRALGIAIRTFDAWMLADETALSQILGQTIQRQSDPEENRDPKKNCKELCGESMAQSAFYSQVAAKLDLNVLEKSCPNGFAPFAQRLRKLIA